MLRRWSSILTSLDSSASQDPTRFFSYVFPRHWGTIYSLMPLQYHILTTPLFVPDAALPTNQKLLLTSQLLVSCFSTSSVKANGSHHHSRAEYRLLPLGTATWVRRGEAGPRLRLYRHSAWTSSRWLSVQLAVHPFSQH